MPKPKKKTPKQYGRGLASKLKARKAALNAAAGVKKKKPKYPAGATERDKKAIDARRKRETEARKKAGK